MDQAVENPIERKRDNRNIWTNVFKLCRTPKASKRRWGRAPKTSKPSMDDVKEWKKHRRMEE